MKKILNKKLNKVKEKNKTLKMRYIKNWNIYKDKAQKYTERRS
jgi:hypothetical protein